MYTLSWRPHASSRKGLPDTVLTVTPAGGKLSAERRAQTEAHNRALVAAHAEVERGGLTLSPSQLNRLVKRFEREAREAAASYVGRGPIVDRLSHSDPTANEALHNMVLAEKGYSEPDGFDEKLAQYVPDPAERRAMAVMSSVSGDQFEQVLQLCRAEGDLSQANVARRCMEVHQ